MGKTLADGYLELRLDPSKLDDDTKKAFKAVGFKQKGSQAGHEVGEGLADAAKEKIKAGLGTALGAIGIGAGIGAGLSSGIKGALDVGAANDKLRAQLNLSKEESGRLGAAAGQLYSKGYGESMGEVNDAISSVVRNVPALRSASVPVLKDIASGALDIARVFDQDVGGVTSAVSSMLKSGLAPNAQAALDILSKGFQSGADKGGDLLDTFTEYSVQFKKLGLDAPTSLGVINQLLAGGARNADVAADAIKEFSIRAIDGSKTTVAGYKILGLNAEATAASIAKGGPAAEKAFGTVVTKLNSIEDPVKRNAAGVDLFGTKWEDLGDSFRKLDVSKATSQIGQVAGATKGLADQSDSARISSFIRGVQSGFVSIIGGQVLPVVQRFAAVNREELAGAMATAGNIGRNVLLPMLKTIGAFLVGTVVPAISATVGWFRQHSTVARVLGVTLGVVVASITAYNVGVKIASTATVVWTAVTKAAGVASKVWAGFQWLLNAALSANPIGLVVVALAALVAGLVVAYKNSETFRKIVQGAWQGIQTAVSFAWNNVIKPVVEALVGLFRGVLAPTALWLYRNIFKPVFEGVGRAVQAAWVVMQIALKAFQIYLNTVIIPVVRFLYNNVIKPIFTAAGVVISAWWNSYAKPVFNQAKAAFGLLGTALRATWEKVIRPVFNALGGFITGTVLPAFRKGVDLIAGAWGKIRDAARVPVAFVVNKIVNPFIGGINKAAGIVGVKDRIPAIAGFAEGGRIPGAPSSVDNMLAAGPGGLPIKVASGEFIVNAADTAKALPLLHWINQGMKGGPARIGAYLGKPLADMPGDGSEGWAFADGGLVGWVKDVWGAISNPVEAIKKPFESLLGRIPGGGMIRDFLLGSAKRMLNGAVSWLGNIGGAGAGDGTFAYHGPRTSKVGQAQQFIRAQAGKPYVWASAGPGGYDCSGIVSAAYNILKGDNPYNHTFSTGSLPGGFFQPGPGGPLLAGWSHPGQSPAGPSVGHMAGQIAGLPFESRGSRGVIVGAGARRVGEFAHLGHFAKGGRVPLFDNGGTLMPGLNTVYNGLGKPEPLVRAGTGNTYNINVTVAPGGHPADTGRQIVEAIQAYERISSKRWRTA